MSPDRGHSHAVGQTAQLTAARVPACFGQCAGDRVTNEHVGVDALRSKSFSAQKGRQPFVLKAGVAQQRPAKIGVEVGLATRRRDQLRMDISRGRDCRRTFSKFDAQSDAPDPDVGSPEPVPAECANFLVLSLGNRLRLREMSMASTTVTLGGGGKGRTQVQHPVLLRYLGVRQVGS